MRRDVDLIRAILIEVEKSDSLNRDFSITIEGYTDQLVNYHVKLLAQAGYLEVNHISCREFEEWRPISLTWTGHEFLDAARDNTVWNRTKEKIGEKLPSITFDVLKSMLNITVKQQFGLEI